MGLAGPRELGLKSTIHSAFYIGDNMSVLRGSIRLALLSAIFCAGGVNAATPHTVNAAEIGTGVPRGLNWSDEAAQSPVWCGTACSYLKLSTAKIAPDSLWTFTPTTWPNSPVTSIPNPSAV